MKLFHHILYTSVIFFLMTEGACTKEKIYKTYTGNFLFHVNTSTWNVNTGYSHTTSSYAGTIKKSETRDPGQPKKYATIDIQYASGITIKTAIDKNGAFPTTKISGGFSDNDHLTFVVEGGGLSSNYSDSVTGIRN